MGISAIICTRNRSDQIGRAVTSVLQNDYAGFELIVIDQSDTDATRLVVEPSAREDSRLTYLHTSRVGLSAAYNAGIRRAKHPLLAFTDDDCSVGTGWLTSIARAFERHSNADLLYGQVVAPTELVNAPGILPQLPISRRELLNRANGFRIYGMGANFAARRELFAQVGGFDEVLGGGGPLRSSQDFDLQYRVYRAGLTTLLEPEVVVTHYGIRATHDWPQTMRAYGVGNGGFYMKHLRCGDALVARLLISELTYQAVRVTVKPLLRKKHPSTYFRGILRGLAQSFEYPIDRDKRLYRAT